MEIMTVRGPIRRDALGTPLPHEHLRDGLYNDAPLITRDKEAGDGTIVEVTNHGLGRNPAGLRSVAEATGLHVVMGCGWYREPSRRVSCRSCGRPA